jgi:hypothetical protein
MLTYAPPLRDMRFVLHELHDCADLTRLPGFEEVTPARRRHLLSILIPQPPQNGRSTLIDIAGFAIPDPRH